MKTYPNNHSNPDEALFFRICDNKFGESLALPFHMDHSEYHLRLFSEFEKIHFEFNNPDYVEDAKESEKPKDLNIVKDGKFGIQYWLIEKHWDRN